MAATFAAAWPIMLGNLLGSVLGLARLQVIAAVFGQGATAGDFFAALRTPQQISDLLLGGTVSAALIPTLAALAGHPRAQRRLAGVLLRLAAGALAVAAAGVIVAAPWLTAVVNGGFAPADQAQTARLVAVLALGLPAQGASAVLTALLYARRRTALAASAPALTHLGAIVGALALSRVWGVGGLAAGVVAGLVAQAALLVWATRDPGDLHDPGLERPGHGRRPDDPGDLHDPGLERPGHGRLTIAREGGLRDLRRGFTRRVNRRRGFAFWDRLGRGFAFWDRLGRGFAFWDRLGRGFARREAPDLRNFWRLYLPAMAGLVAGVALGQIDQRLQSGVIDPATGLRGGPVVAALAAATALIQFPAGIVAAALGFAALPELTRARDDPARFAATVRLGLRLGVFLMVPVLAAYEALSGPAVALLFQHHAFGPADTARTALALRAYAWQLPALAVEQVAMAAFFARGDARTPLAATAIGIASYLAVALPGVGPFGMPALAAANAAQHVGAAVFLALALARRTPGVFGREVARSAGRAALGALALAGTSLAATRALPHAGPGLPAQIVALGAPLAVGLAAYLGVTAALGAQELRELPFSAWFRRRPPG